ncbi:MAG: phosphoglucosamine mutase, partial [Enterovibrio sp.]
SGGVVGTLMSNMGLEVALRLLDVPFARANVGDRYVLELMQERGWTIGAENSGHVILLDKVTTGDGIVAALQVLAGVVATGESLHKLSQSVVLFPQVLENVRFSGSSDPLLSKQVLEAKADVEAKLGNNGRVLLRKSGTEPLIRVMVEGENAHEVSEFAKQISAAVKASC